MLHSTNPPSPANLQSLCQEKGGDWMTHTLVDLFKLTLCLQTGSLTKMNHSTMCSMLPSNPPANLQSSLTGGGVTLEAGCRSLSLNWKSDFKWMFQGGDMGHNAQHDLSPSLANLQILCQWGRVTAVCVI